MRKGRDSVMASMPRLHAMTAQILDYGRTYKREAEHLRHADDFTAPDLIKAVQAVKTLHPLSEVFLRALLNTAQASREPGESG